MNVARPRFSFAKLSERDFTLMHRWLNEPHVRRWWDRTMTLEDVRGTYQAHIDSPWVDPMIVKMGGVPIGYIQSYRASRVGGGWWPGVDDSVVGIDQFIGESALIGKGLGPIFIRQYAGLLLADPATKRIITDPDPANLAAIRAYEKAGFRAVGEVETPDGRSLLMEFSQE